MRPDHPLAAEKRLTLAACAQYPIILPAPRLSTHAVLVPHLVELGEHLAVVAEVESIELMRSLTLRLNAISFHLRLGLETELRTRQLVHVPLQCAGGVTTELGLYVRRGCSVSAALDAFVTLTRDRLAGVAEVRTGS